MAQDEREDNFACCLPSKGGVLDWVALEEECSPGETLYCPGDAGQSAQHVCTYSAIPA